MGPMENLIYIIHDHASNRAAIVDPAWDVDAIVARAKEKNIKITDILLTHYHDDHINGVDDLVQQTDAQVHLLKDEAKYISGNFLSSAKLYYGGDKIKLGETEIEILHTPGHSPGSACFHIGGELITGDTLFVFGCGHCRLQGADPNQLFDTLTKLKTAMPKQTVIHPGHNYAEKTTSTIEEQIEGNPFFHFDNVDKFIRYRMIEHDQIRTQPYQPIIEK
ncbi:MAG TPA: MBL fold metallo-hydrolase [Gammaproteobacteria bacterium]|nr:MBL fold metallo-hydrolase [Gammaproteobacteria bacterium]